uniref:p505_1R n=1 Tax=African swine fever virus TaxID=10497 RepID=A0A6G7KUE8_ASF
MSKNITCLYTSCIFCRIYITTAGIILGKPWNYSTSRKQLCACTTTYPHSRIRSPANTSVCRKLCDRVPFITVGGKPLLCYYTSSTGQPPRLISYICCPNQGPSCNSAIHCQSSHISQMPYIAAMLFCLYFISSCTIYYVSRSSLFYIYVTECFAPRSFTYCKGMCKSYLCSYYMDICKSTYLQYIGYLCMCYCPYGSTSISFGVYIYIYQDRTLYVSSFTCSHSFRPTSPVYGGSQRILTFYPTNLTVCSYQCYFTYYSITSCNIYPYKNFILLHSSIILCTNTTMFVHGDYKKIFQENLVLTTVSPTAFHQTHQKNMPICCHLQFNKYITHSVYAAEKEDIFTYHIVKICTIRYFYYICRSLYGYIFHIPGKNHQNGRANIYDVVTAKNISTCLEKSCGYTYTPYACGIHDATYRWEKYTHVLVLCSLLLPYARGRNLYPRKILCNPSCTKVVCRFLCLLSPTYYTIYKPSFTLFTHHTYKRSCCYYYHYRVQVYWQPVCYGSSYQKRNLTGLSIHLFYTLHAFSYFFLQLKHYSYPRKRL